MSFLTSIARTAPPRLRASAAAAVRLNSSSSHSGPSSTAIEAQRQHEASGLTTSHPSPEIIEADVLSDAPTELHYRPVRIFKPAKSTMQSGRAGYNHWKLDWDVLQGSGRWENPLMGWASSADYMQGTAMKFKTKEDAIHFAEKQGWDYTVVEPKTPKIPPKNYANNYVHVPGKLRICHTK